MVLYTDLHQGISESDMGYWETGSVTILETLLLHNK